MGPYGEDRARSFLDHAFGDAAQQQVLEAGAAVGADHDQVDVALGGLLDDHGGRIALADHDFRRQRGRLGRGLAALIGEMDKPALANAEGGRDQAVPNVVTDRVVPIESIRPNPNNPTIASLV